MKCNRCKGIGVIVLQAGFAGRRNRTCVICNGSGQAPPSREDHDARMNTLGQDPEAVPRTARRRGGRAGTGPS